MATESNHESAVLPIGHIVRSLVDNLGRRLVGAVAGLEGNAPVEAWTSVRGPDIEQETRLRTAHQAFEVVSECESLYVARAWMIGMNPHLGDESPVIRIAEGRYRDVLAAARTHANNDTFG